MPDIPALCLPVSPDQPAGEDMSLSSEFDAIADARRADDPSLPQGEWVTDLKTANWPLVETLCSQLLIGHSKDLRVAVWLMEAWGHQRAFAGLADGLRLLAALCENYWTDIHPIEEEEEDDARAVVIEKVISSCLAVMSSQSLTQSGERDWNHGDYQSVRHEARQSGADDESEGQASGLVQFESALRSTPEDYHAGLLAGLADMEASLQRFEVTLEESAAATAVSFAAIRALLEELSRIIPSEDGGSSSAPGHAATTSAAVAAGANPSVIEAGAVTGRSQAIAQLRSVAAFFRRTEPHSPVTYLAEKAAAWGEMPLHDWLRQVMHDETELAHLEELLGIKPPPNRDAGEN